MPAARYWRIARIETFAGGDLELSEVALYEGATRVDGAATVSAVVAPASGALADLGDASFSTSARWPGDAVRLPGFAVVWDFGAGVTKDVTSVGVAGPGQAAFAHQFVLEYSADGAAWARLYATVMGSKWSGSDAFFLLDAAATDARLRGLVVAHLGTVSQATAYQFDGSMTEALPAFMPAPGSSAYGVAVSQSGTLVAIGAISEPRLNIYTRIGRKFLKIPIDGSMPSGVQGVAFSPDGAYLAVAHAGSPFVSLFKITDGAVVTRLGNPATLPTGTGNSAAFSPDGVYLAVAHDSSPYLTIYKRSGDTFTKLANPATLPTGNAESVAFSPDGALLAVGHGTSRFLTIYSRSGDTFTKVADPATLPSGTATGLAFSPDGAHLAVGSANAPRWVIYSRSGTTFTALSLPAGLPASTPNGVAYSPDGSHLAIACGLAPYLFLFSRSGDVYTQIASPSAPPESVANAAAWLPFTESGPAVDPANYDATPVRRSDVEPLTIGEDVAGATQPSVIMAPPQLDIYDAGRGRITGTVKEKNTPANTPLMRRVVLLSMPGSRAIRETWSDSVTGVYTFDEVAMDRTYTVVSYDHTGIYRGVVADNLTPEVMP